jgi:hypothetical protein
MLVLWAGKKLIAVPRIGRVKFGTKGRVRKRRIRWILTIKPSGAKPPTGFCVSKL